MRWKKMITEGFDSALPGGINVWGEVAGKRHANTSNQSNGLISNYIDLPSYNHLSARELNCRKTDNFTAGFH